MTDPIFFRIFLSSPSDVAAERKIAREELDKLNADPFIREYARIESVSWEDVNSRVLMPILLTPQEAINLALAKPSETDAVIVIFWGRMGTPLDEAKHGKKTNGEPYWSGTEWEFLDAIHGAKENSNNLPIVYVYRRIDTPPLPDGKDLRALEQYVIQNRRINDFFEQFRDPESGAYRGTVHEYATPDAFREQFAIDTRLIIKELLKIRQKSIAEKTSKYVFQEVPPLVNIDWKGSPFPGLRAFTEKDEPIFFGRGYESADLINRLANQRLMVVVGASGSGKSSLVKAGLIPQLNRGALYGVANWYVVILTPGNEPFKRLAAALLKTIPVLKDPMADDDERAEQQAEIFRKSGDRLSKQVEKWLCDEPEGTEILLFIDQFEELYTTTLDAERVAFADMLKYFSPQIRVITTLRSDFYDKALNDFETILRDSTYTLSTPSPLALYDMILRPAQATGLEFEVGLPEIIVEKTMGQSGGLALVAYLLEELYLRAKTRGDGRLTKEDYDALGGVEKAIATRADAVYSDLNLDDDRKRSALKRVFHELVEPTLREGQIVATRRRIFFELFENDADACALINAFTAARLLVRDQGMVEVAHEALLREWDELAMWIVAIGDDLRQLRQIEREAHDWNTSGRTYRLSIDRLRHIHQVVERLNVKSRLASNVLDFVYPQMTMMEELNNPATNDQIRLRIGDDLALLGDIRPGVSVCDDGVPDILWLPVKGSGKKFTFQHNQGFAYGEFIVQPFYVAQYMVTYAQYQAFYEAQDGFNNLEWWRNFSEINQPQELSDQRTKSLNNPRDSISWYQAVAFTHWLNHRLKGIKLVHPSGNRVLRVGDNAEVRLPTEWEWQWIVHNGVQKRDYPWRRWENGYANTSESGLGRAIAVGMYPQGAADCGAMDMAGNLWEWCLGQEGYNDSERWYVQGETHYRYYSNSKILRGGSFDDNRESSHAWYCKHFAAGFRSYNAGFRVVVGSPIESI